MEFKTYTTHSPQTPYAPVCSFCMGKTKLSINLDNLIKTCIQKEKSIKKIPLQYYESNSGKKIFDGYTNLGKNSTTSRSSLYNVLSWETPETNLLRNYIRECVEEYNNFMSNPTPKNMWIRCWVNIMRFGQKINPHVHNVKPTSYLSAHFTLQCEKTSTCYINPLNQINDPEIIMEKNFPGQFTLFPSFLPHYTTRHFSFTPRITMAMDIVTQNWDYDPGILL